MRPCAATFEHSNHETPLVWTSVRARGLSLCQTLSGILASVENSEPVGLNMQLQWVGDLVSPATPVNQIMIMPDAPIQTGAESGGHILMFGNVNVPIFVGEVTPEIAAELSSQPLPVMPVARMYLTTARLREFHEVIGRHLAQLD